MNRIDHEPGTRVRFATSFLRSTGQYTGPEAPASHGPFARGKLVGEHKVGRVMVLAEVEWDDGKVSRAHPASLAFEIRPGLWTDNSDH